MLHYSKKIEAMASVFGATVVSSGRKTLNLALTSPRRRNCRSLTSVQHLELRLLLSAGDLDPTFSDDGIARVNVTGHIDKAYGVAIQNDGKIVTVGVGETNSWFAMSRLHSDGTLDTSFGPSGTGKVKTRVGTGVQEARGVAIQPDQRIVVVGQAGGSGGDFGVARYMTNGSLDSSFNGDGLFSMDVAGREDIAYRVVIQPDGYIVAAGKASRSATDFDFMIVRLRPDGELDANFGNGGVTYVNFPGGASFDVAYDIAIQPSDGKLVVIGTASNSNFFGTARLNSNGSLDTSFSEDGMVATDFGGNVEGGQGIVVQPDGKIVVAGNTNHGNRPNDFALARYNTNGSLDLTFGPNATGKLTTDWFAENVGDTAYGLALQANGKLLVSGKTFSKNGDQYAGAVAVARYNSDGSLDPQFGIGGFVRTSLNNHIGDSRAIALQADGNIVLAGYFGNDFSLYRYQGDSTQVQFDSATTSVHESAGSATITVVRTGGGTGPFSVNYATGNGTATSGSDYLERSGTLQFGAGELRKTFTIPILEDALAEPNETINLSLSNPTNNVLLGNPQSAVLTISDFNGKGLSIAATDAAKVEGNSGNTQFIFTVTRSHDTSGPTSLNYLVAGSGTTPANAGDFGGGFPSGSVSFASNEISKTITINVTGDTLPESDEGFTVTLSNATNGASILTSSATGVIQDDDGTRTIFTVTNPNDAGSGSFRQAIIDANDSAGRDLIKFSIGIGSWTISPMSPLPLITDAVVIDGTTQPGFTGRPLIELDGINAGDSDGLKITAGNSIIRGLVIGGFQQSGIVLSDGDNNIVEGNFIGTNWLGTVGNGNDFGVKIEAGSAGNRIGTDGNGVNDAQEMNLLSGNRADGVLIKGTGSDNNWVAGNLIGTDRSGFESIPNSHGIRIELGANGNRVGTNGDGVADATERNVISGNRLSGVLLINLGTNANLVSGNFIGTDISGLGALGNNEHGVILLDQAQGNRIGLNGDHVGDTAERNIIAGNGYDGIYIGDTGTDGNFVMGNFIGVNASGVTAAGNNYGIRIDNGAMLNLIGTDADGVADLAERNIVSGNRSDGILINAATTSRNTVAGNYVGTDSSGTSAVGNAWSGVAIIDASNNQIGGRTPGAGNLLSNNGFDGVVILSGTGNAVPGNSISANGRLGIELKPDGVTANDVNDSDTGPNNLQNFPVLSKAIGSSTNTQIQGSLGSGPNATFQLDFYASDAIDESGYGEGRQYLGTTTVVTNSSGTMAFSVTLPVAVPVGSWITCTATDGSNNTSEFSQAFRIEFPPTNIALSNTTVAENQPTGTSVGTLSATDPDPGSTFTYALVAGIGSTDNSKFTINGNSLKTAASFDFETKSSYAIRVKVTDADGLSFEKQFTIAVTDVVEGMVIISPAAFTTAQRPVFSWTAVPGATSYETWVNKAPGTMPFDKATVTQASYTPSNDFGVGKFYLWVRSITNGVASPWTSPYTFVINTAATIHPMTRSQPTLRPTISWNALPGAVKYDVWINDVSRGTLQYIRNSNVTGTSFTPSSDMPMGVYRAWVRGIAADGTSGNWSGAVEFQTMQAPTITAPLNSTFNNRPVFMWNPVAGAASYQVQVRNLKTGVTVYNQIGLTTTNWTPPANLANGPYRWWVVASGPNNLRGFSTSPVDFSVGGDTALLTPVGTTNNRRPAFTWKPVDGAARYELWVNNISQNIRAIYETNLTTASYTSATSLPAGTFRAWIRAVSTVGTVGPWSLQADFVIVQAPLETINRIAAFDLNQLKTPDGIADQWSQRRRNAEANVSDKNSSLQELQNFETALLPVQDDVSMSVYDAVMEEFTHSDFTA